MEREMNRREDDDATYGVDGKEHGDDHESVRHYII